MIEIFRKKSPLVCYLFIIYYLSLLIHFCSFSNSLDNHLINQNRFSLFHNLNQNPLTQFQLHSKCLLLQRLIQIQFRWNTANYLHKECYWIILYYIIIIFILDYYIIDLLRTFHDEMVNKLGEMVNDDLSFIVSEKNKDIE